MRLPIARRLGALLAPALLALATVAQALPLTASEQGLFDAMNQARIDAGVGTLTLNDALAAAAARHAADMQALGTPTHVGSDGSNFGQRISEAGYSAVLAAELIGLGFADGASLVSAWLGSPEHRAFLLGAGFLDVGVARNGSAWVAELASGTTVHVPPPAGGDPG